MHSFVSLQISRHKLLARPNRSAPHNAALIRWLDWMKGKEMASTGDIWVQWFTCCFHQPQSPGRRRQHRQRLRIDRSMIGHPTNFVHTGKWRHTLAHIRLVRLINSINCMLSILTVAGHIGSNDAELTSNHLNAIQSQMQSKGGYEMNSLRVQVILRAVFGLLHICIYNMYIICICVWFTNA